MPGYYEFEVTLAEIEPRIWRRFLISSDATFGDLHDAIQDAFGWFDEHLWAFQEPGPHGETIAGVPDEDDDTTPDARAVRLTNFFDGTDGRDQCLYIYDFGDRWHHEVVLQRKDSGVGGARIIPAARLCAGVPSCAPNPPHA